MLYAIIGTVAGTVLVLVWWHRVLLTVWLLVAMLWTAVTLGKIIPISWNKWITNKIVVHPLMAGLEYSVKEIESGKLGGHMFDNDDD